MYILPPPETVAGRFVGAWLDGTVWPHFQTTMVEIVVGFVVGTVLALLVGYGLARSDLFERLASPYLVAAQAIPILVLAPLLVLWFGPGLVSKVVICALIVFFPVAIATMVGIRSVDARLLELGRSLRATRRQILTTLEVPAALPNIFGGLRVGVTLAVVGAVVGEWAGASKGLAVLINLARGSLFDIPLMFAALLTIALVGVALYLDRRRRRTPAHRGPLTRIPARKSRTEVLVSSSRRHPASLVLVLAVIGSLVAACGAGGGSSGSVPPSNPPVATAPGESPEESIAPTKLVVGLGFIPSVQFAQFYLAQQNGYYADAGLDVEFQNKIDPDLIPLVGAGTIDIGIGDGTSVIPAASQGIPIEYVATIYGQFPNIVFAKASSGIKKAADLKGKKIGTPGKYGSGWVMLQAMLASGGLTTDDVEIVEYPGLHPGDRGRTGRRRRRDRVRQQRAGPARAPRREGRRPARRRRHAAARSGPDRVDQDASRPSTTRSRPSSRPRSRR